MTPCILWGTIFLEVPAAAIVVLSLSSSTYLQNYTASHPGRQNFSIHHRVNP
jgi:hypothetical protein